MGFRKMSNTIEPDITICDERFFTRSALAKGLGKSNQTLAGWATRKFGPSYVQIGRKVLYPENEVKRWIKDRTVSFKNAD